MNITANALIPMKKFNLIYEPWVQVMTMEGEVKELSLIDVFASAPMIAGLCGETEAQNAAVLRFLEAILHTVITRWDNSGNPLSFELPDHALERWEDIWDDKQLPVDVIKEYLTEWEDFFWLIHPDHPFYQQNMAKCGTAYTAAKLYGDLSESGNKIRLFQSRTGFEKESCSYGEAARWLLFVNGYDDTASKAKQKGLDSPGAGWLGQLGQIYIKGNNLFETLMLNCILLKNGQVLWGPDYPFWETQEKISERVKINAPENYAYLLTLPSRWLLLTEADGRIDGFTLLGGQFFDKKNSLVEQYTLWRQDAESKKKKGAASFVPRRHDASRQIWREFASYVPLSEDRRKTLGKKAEAAVVVPGVISWLKRLVDEGSLTALDDSDTQYRPLTISTCGVQYGDKDFYITDLIGDSMTIPHNLLSSKNEDWVEAIHREILKIDDAAYQAGLLSARIAEAAGNSGDSVRTSRISDGKARYYAAIDHPFKLWLSSLQIDGKNLDMELISWEETARKCSWMVSNEIIDQYPESSIFGRSSSKEKLITHISMPEAVSYYRRSIHKIFSLRREEFATENTQANPESR